MDGRSVQYEEYSTREVVESMNGGADKEERSPENDAADLMARLQSKVQNASSERERHE